MGLLVCFLFFEIKELQRSVKTCRTGKGRMVNEQVAATQLLTDVAHTRGSSRL